VIHIVDRVSSTNTWLSRNSMRANDGIIALQQTRGKGRGVRIWESPPGGLYLSIITPSHSLLSFIAGISVTQTLVGLNNRLRLKWPNDLILDGKKVGGILCEDDDKCAVVGIGINLNNSPSFPNSINLASVSYGLDEYRFLKSFFVVFRENLQKSNKDIISRFRDYDCLLGRDITWDGATGIAKSINSDGSLEVLSDGKLVNLYSEDVHLE
jgi:BirA family biotin operon repressor/biotin-[acetyl-CoA-carboxylase] ligase